jgi:hypothetical protein
MTWALYALPIAGTGANSTDPRRPKYVKEAPELAGLQWSMMDYGHNPHCLMAADVSPAQDAFLVAQADVRAIPDDLDSAVGGALNAVQNALEAMSIPAGWVTAGTTWREVVRTVGGLFQFAQRYASIANGQTFLPAGVNLNNTWGSISAARRTNVTNTAASFEPPYSMAGITNGTTIRAALKLLADQWGDRPFVLGGMTF